jgi:exopolysaccharide production protein ExoY
VTGTEVVTGWVSLRLSNGLQFESVEGCRSALGLGTMKESTNALLVESGFLETETRIPAWKRVLDISFVLLTSPLWGTAMLLCAVLIKCISRGPVLYRQVRIGYRGQRFDCLKFRTMHVNAETETHTVHLDRLMHSDRPMIKIDLEGDPRVIPLGRLLRASGLDELPQLFNVLRGEMSLVGPRPCTLYEYRNYEPWQKKRFEAMPGLTGLWQVSGKNQTTFVQMIHLDIHYLTHLSLGLDLVILLKTFRTLMLQVWEYNFRGRRLQTES